MASSSISSHAASVIGAWLRSRWPLIACSPRTDAERAVVRARRAAAVALGVVLAGGGLGRLAVLDDVAVLEEDPARDRPPLRRAPQQELQVHREVLVLLADRVGS